MIDKNLFSLKNFFFCRFPLWVKTRKRPTSQQHTIIIYIKRKETWPSTRHLVSLLYLLHLRKEFVTTNINTRVLEGTLWALGFSITMTRLTTKKRQLNRVESRWHVFLEYMWGWQTLYTSHVFLLKCYLTLWFYVKTHLFWSEKDQKPACTTRSRRLVFSKSRWNLDLVEF